MSHLLRKGADPEKGTKSGQEPALPLELAAYNGHIEVVEYLAKESHSDGLESALHYAVKAEQYNILDTLFLLIMYRDGRGKDREWNIIQEQELLNVASLSMRQFLEMYNPDLEPCSDIEDVTLSAQTASESIRST